MDLFRILAGLNDLARGMKRNDKLPEHQPLLNNLEPQLPNDLLRGRATMATLDHEAFQVAGGSTIGRDHRNAQKNFQDGFYILNDDVCTVGIVTDGCGSSPFSEVGAHIGARLIAENIQAEIHRIRTSVSGRRNAKTEAINWQKVRRSTLSALDVLTRQMGGDYLRTVMDYFLFTVVGFVLADRKATFFALGDGVIFVNGLMYPIGPYPGNAPPYIGYGLIGDSLTDSALGELPIEAITEIDLKDLCHFLIGSDGVIDLMDATEQNVPGSDKPVGTVDQFWSEDKYFSNPELINRRLRLIGRDWPRQNPDPGLLHDDTTLIVGRLDPDRDKELMGG